ncbi:MAG TPA: DUF4118 domain-containing protein [Rhodospirillales bacterium]|nr:DUF4118 domain-containing protein [Rhodospirillales bacterium]
MEVTSEREARAPAAGVEGRRGWFRAVRPYLGAVAIVVAALALALVIKTHLFVANVALIFLGGVVLCAARWGLKPALLSCLLSVLALNYFVFPPLHDLRVEDPENVIAVVIFVAVAVFVGRLTAKARAGTALAERRAMVTEDLYGFARSLASIDDLNELLRVTARQIRQSFAGDVVVLLQEQQVLTVRAAVPAAAGDLDAAELVQAEAIVMGSQKAMSADATGGSRYVFLPMRSAGDTFGAVAISRSGRRPELSAEERQHVAALVDQAAVAVNRLMLHSDIERARVATETERLRSAMLSAISHDLKTPLASILGAASSLGTYNSYFEQQGRDELVATIREEAERMNRFLINLLDITRVESDSLEIHNEATDIGEVIGAAVRRARQIIGSRRLRLNVVPDLPLLDLDAVLLEQTLFNLLDNAGKYSPTQSVITVEASRVGLQAVIKVRDEGPGIPAQDVQRIFEKFYRSARSGRQRAGTGLGLAISRGFVEAMGGRIIAGNRTDRSGAVFMIFFPLPKNALLQQVPEVDND